MSKFRCRQLDASKPILIYYQEDIYDSSEFNNVTNRSVPQLPTGMEKEEETEHHLQQAIFHNRVIPVPEVYESESHDDKIAFDQLYPSNFKASRQFIHIHPFSTEQDIPDYDMDSEDEDWLQEHSRKGELLPLMPSQFEEMMDRLEKASGLKAVTLQEAKLLLKDDDDLITAVYDYWLNKRLTLQHPLLSQVKSEKCGNSSTTDPYVAFRKRTEKMQTRKNRKNDETSYGKMLKLRRNLTEAITVLEMVKGREKTKRELLHLNIEVHEKRYEMEDFSGAILNEINSQRSIVNHRAAFAPIIPNHQLEIEDAEAENLTNSLWHKIPSRTTNKIGKRRDDGRRERRPYKKKKRSIVSISSAASSSHLARSYSHPTDSYTMASMYSQGGSIMMGASEDDIASTSHSEAEDESSVDGYFTFRRNGLVSYMAPKEWTLPDESVNYSLASISQPHEQLMGRCRRRVGRGGRVLLDRLPTLDSDRSDLYGPNGDINTNERLHFRPSCPMEIDSSSSDDDEVDVETVAVRTMSPHHRRRPLGGDRRTAEDLPSTLLICAEVLEGTHAGVVTELNVTIPPSEENVDFLSNPVLLEDSSSITSSTAPTDDDLLFVRSRSVYSKPSDDTCLTSSVVSGSVVTSATSSFSNSLTMNNTSNTSSVCATVQQHSNFVDFQTQQSSKFADSSSQNHGKSVPSTVVSGESNSLSCSNDSIVIKSSSKTIVASPSLNNIFCASSKKDDNTTSQQCKKVKNLSSIFICQPKDGSQNIQMPSGFLLSNRNNGNNVVTNSQKMLWSNNSDVTTTTNSSSEETISNGPKKTNLKKCTKVNPISFHDT